MEHRLSALLQLHLHSQLNTRLQWIGQSQLQYEARNGYVLRLGASYIRELTVICLVFYQHINGSDEWHWNTCRNNSQSLDTDMQRLFFIQRGHCRSLPILIGVEGDGGHIMIKRALYIGIKRLWWTRTIILLWWALHTTSHFVRCSTGALMVCNFRRN